MSPVGSVIELDTHQLIRSLFQRKFLLVAMAPYILRGFDTEEEAQEKSRQMVRERLGIDPSDPEETTEFLFDWTQISDESEEEWALVVPEDMTEHIEEEERKSERFVWVEPTKRHSVNTPHMFRYMPQEYIDDFFEDGTLRLSSFERFSRHEDEIRRDSSEGGNILWGRGEDKTMMAVTHHGHNAYVLCGSTIGSDRLMDRFGENGYFRIKDTTSFAVEVLKSLESHESLRCQGIVEGFCIYKSKRSIERPIDIDFEDMKLDDGSGNIDMGKMQEKVAEIGGQDVFFVKEKSYQEECEYRILWIMSDKVDGITDVQCPEARKYCEKVT